MFDPELAPQKGIDLQNTLQAKIDILNSKTAEKQFDTATMEAQLRSSVNTFQEPNQPLIPYKETLPEAAARGVVESVKGIPMLASGVVAGGALVAEKIVGEGGIATKIKEAAAGKYHKIEQDIGVGAQPEDSFTYSYEKAKEGDWKALVSWFSHGSGYVAGQLTSLLVGSGIIKTGVELTGKKAISKLMGGLVKKEADRIAKQQLITQGAKVTTENIAKVAATDSVSKLAISSVTSKAGTHIGMASAGFGLEGGEIFGTLSQEADVTWKQIQKAGIATGLAGAVEYLDLLFNVKALKGGLSTIGGLGKKVSGVAGKATRVGVTAGKVAPVEFAEEYAQTAIEQWGTGKNPFSAESRKEQFDAGMLGSLGGPVTSVGGVFTRSEQEQQESTERKAERKALRVKANPKAQLGYEDKLSAAVETEDISMHKDNPVLAAEALQQINQKKDLDPSVKITNHDKAIEIHNAVDAEFQEQIKEVQKYQAIKEERELTKEEGELAVSAMKQAMASKAIIDQIVPVIDSMGREETASPEKLKEVKTILKGSDSVKIQEAILTVFGSKGDFTDADINEVLNNPKIDDITKVKFKRILSYQKSAKATLEGQKSPINKTSAQVHQDIINGSIKDKFKGIKGYKQAIAIAMQNKNTKLAKSQLSDLQAFTERHAIKADLFRRLQDAVIKAKAKTTKEQEAVIKTFSAADQKFLEQLNTERASIGYNADYDFNTNFEASIQSMEREADSLSEALSVAQDMITPPQAQPTAEEVVQAETEEEEISAATAEDVSSEEVGSNEQPLSAEQEITSLVKTNKGKWVTVDFPKYTGTFKAQVTGNVIPDSFSIVNGVKTVTGYSIEIKTNTGKVLTATAQELGLKAYKTDQDIETTTPVQEDFVVEEEDTFFGQDESETFLTLEEMTKAELQTLYQNTEKTNTDRRQEIEAVLRTKHATEKKPKKEDGSKPEENADDASAFSESEPSESNVVQKLKNLRKELQTIGDIDLDNSRGIIKKLEKVKNWDQTTSANIIQQFGIDKIPQNLLKKLAKKNITLDMLQNTEKTLNAWRAKANEIKKYMAKYETKLAADPDAVKNFLQMFKDSAQNNNKVKQDNRHDIRRKLMAEFYENRNNVDWIQKQIVAREKRIKKYYSKGIENYFDKSLYYVIKEEIALLKENNLQKAFNRIAKDGEVVGKLWIGWPTPNLKAMEAQDASKPEEKDGEQPDLSETEASEKTLFRGQEEAPYIDDKGNLVLTPTHDSLFKNIGISFAEDKELAEEYGNRYSKNPFIIQINTDYLDKIFPLNRQGGTAVTDERVVGDEREQRIVTKKDIIIPKGQYSVSKKNIKYDHSTTATSVLMDELDKENYEGDISEHLRYGEVAQGYASNEQEYYDSIKQELKNRNFSETDFAFISNNPITTDPDSIMEALGIDPKTNKWKNSYNTEYQNRRKQLYEKTASEKHVPLAEQLTDKTGIDRESLTPGNTNNTDLANNRLWVNTLRAFFKPIYGKAGPKSLLNKIPDFVAAMRKKILSKNHSLNPDQEKAAIALMKFNKEFSATLLKTFRPKANEKFFYEDAVNYFRVNGELNPNFLMAMSATAWKWLATQGPKTLINDDKSIRKIFNLKESQEISEDVRALVSRIGASKDYLSGTLGKDVIKMFEIKATQDIGVFDRELIEQDLGTLLLATLDRMGRVERTQVNAGRIPSTPVKTEKITLGFYGLRNHMLNTPQAPLSPQLINTFILPDQRLDVAKEDVIDRKNTTKVDFFRIASKVVTLKDGTSFEALTNANTQTRTDYEYGKGVWEQLFKLTADPLDYSFTKPTWENDKEKWPLARTSEFATIPQTNNLKQYIEQPYGLSHGVMNIFTFLTNAGQRTAAGAVNINDATHDRHKHRESINRKIELDLDAVRFWLHNAKKETAKYASNFFIQSYFIATGRMQQAGPIQPQNSMTHRFLFKNKAWEATFDKSDEQVVELFKAAVGLSLGVDPTKEASMAIVQQKTTDILESPVIQSALAAIDVFLSAAEQHTEYSPDEMVALRKAQPDLEADILAGIKEGGEDLHTLKGLLEYQRFQRAGAGKFTTSLPVEIDGQANGPTIGGIQLLLSLPTIKNLGIAASEGMVFTENPVETDTVPYDPYQSIGAGWGALVNQLKKTMIAAKDTATYKRMEAAEFLLGKLTDSKGFLDKAVRKLAKNRAVGALYGSGHGKIKRGLVITIIEDGIKAKLEKILEDPTRPAAADELRELVRYTNTLANNPKALFIPANIAGVEGNLNKEALLKIKLNPSIYEDIAAFTNKYHGKALTQAIDKIYGDIQQARTPLNKAITIAAAFYNAAQKMLVQEHVAKFGSVMTQEQLQQIRDRIKKIFPVLKSSLGGKVPLAEFATNLEYTTAVEGTSTQSYQPDGSNVHYQPMHNRAKKLSTLGDPSVKPVIISVQNYDSSSANRAMGNNQGVGVLGVHDGFYVAITNGGAMGQIINKSLYTDMSLDSIPEKIVEAFTTSIEAFTEFANENPAREEKKDRVLQKVFKEMGLTEGVSSYNNKTWTKSVQQVVDETVNGVPEKGKRKKKFGIKEIVRVTKINKARVLNAVTAFNHYFHRDGAWKTGNAPQTSIGGVNIVETKTEPGLYSQATINQQALADYNLSVQELEEAFIAEMLKEDSNDSLGSKDDSTLSIDPAKYGRAQEISSKNVLEVYNDIKGESTVTDSVQHDNHLQRILKTLIHSVFQPVDLYMKTNPYAEPEGKFVSQTRQVFMTNQIAAPITGALNNGIRMSSGEVYTHELLHPVLEAGLRLNARLGAQVDTLYELAYRKLDYRAFLNDPTVNAAWLNDPANQYEIEAAQKRYNYIFRNTRTAAQRKASEQTDTATKITRESGHSPHLAEFVILGLTNENFLKALSGIALPERMYTTSTWSDIQAGNIQQTLLNIAQKIFDFFYSKFNASKNDLRMDRELERLAILLSKIDSNHKNKLFETQSKFEQQYRKVADLSNEYIKKAATSGPLKIVKGLKTAVKTHKEKDSLAGDQLRKMTNDYDRLEYGLFKSLVTELRGRTDRLALIYQLLNRRRVWLDSAKEFTIAQYSGIAGKLFTKFRDPKQTKLTDAEKVVVTKIGLKPDTVALLDSLSMDGISKVLGDPNELRKAINNVLNQIKTDTALAPHLTYYKQAADAMGHFMIHSRGRTGEEVFQNALVIAEMKARDDVTVPLTAAEVLRAEELINQLGSLYALQHTDKASRQVFKELIDTDPEGVNKFFELHQVLKEDSLQKAFNGDERKFIKGYTKEIVNTRTNYQYGTLAEEEELAQIGYSRSEFPIDRDEADPLKHIDIYVYTAQTGRINDLLSTIFSYTGNRGKGTDPLTIAQQMDISTKEGKKNNAKIIKYKAKIIRDMANPNIKPELKPSNQMIPQVDENGITTKYRYMMAETTKDNFLEKVNEYDKIMGAMAGQIIDKERTPIINEELIVLLKDMFDADYQSNPGGFIEIGPNSPDPKLRDIYHMMPDKAKQTVDTVWGGPSMFIPKDVLDISFGYRQYNIVESFAKNPEDRAKLERLLIGIVSLFGGEVKGVRRAHTLEGAMIELAKLAKNNIIVRSLSVTLNNFGSNLFVLRSKGIPFNVIIKSAWEAFSMGLKYQADIQKLADLEVKRRMLAKRKGAAPQLLLDLDNQIMRLKNTIEINPTTKTIEAGLMPQFIDDVNTTISGSNFPSEFEKGVTKLTDKLPQIVQNVGKVTFLTQDTQAYQVLNNAVKMTDFVARHVLYHYYTSSARGDEQMSHEEAVAEAIEEFVNFAVPTHRMIEYLNTIGLLRFTKYGIRILKVIKESAMDKPFDVAAALFLSTHIGADNINNSIPGVTKNMFSNFGNPFSFFVDSVDSILPVNYLKMFFSK